MAGRQAYRQASTQAAGRQQAGRQAGRWYRKLLVTHGSEGDKYHEDTATGSLCR